MRYGSVCSGIEAVTVAWAPLGWKAAWVAEIEPFPCEVLKHHYPEVPNLGDITAADFCERAKELGTIDVLVGGFPCQDLSVAGRRAGLAGERSGLWFRFAEIIGELSPQWVVVENVPGLLSSRGERDFAVLLQGLAGLGYGVAWRCLDAQHWGLAQRRKRVFIVGSLGSGRASQVLLESEGLCWDTEKSRPARQGLASTLGGGAGNRGWADDLDRAGAFIPIGPGEYASGKPTLRKSGGDCAG